jgi:hypothetical protein
VGRLARAYVSAGLDFRHIADIQTTNTFLYADNTSDTNSTPSTPDTANQVGFVAGLGLRFIDKTNVRVTPEVRYVRWMGTTFHGEAYHSVANQIEAGFGISF